MTIAGIGEELGVPAGAAKNSAEIVIVKMFGGTARKINSIDQFAKAGVVAKTVALTPRGGRTEDMKLFPLDLGEAADPGLAYEDTSYYDFFANHQLLCAVFVEDQGGLGGNRFAGFRRLSFGDGFIEGEARKTWEEVRSLVQGGGAEGGAGDRQGRQTRGQPQRRGQDEDEPAEVQGPRGIPPRVREGLLRQEGGVRDEDAVAVGLGQGEHHSGDAGRGRAAPKLRPKREWSDGWHGPPDRWKWLMPTFAPHQGYIKSFMAVSRIVLS
jgi:hypothetical protein